MNKGTKIAIGIGAGCAVLCLVGGVIFLFAGGAFYSWIMEEPENVVIEVKVPATVDLDEKFVIEVQVINTAPESQSLKGIDFELKYLEGILITESAPRFTESFELSLVEFMSYSFEENIPSGESVVVRFSALAILKGNFSGDVDVCINDVAICTTNNVRTVVR
jgi:hypothetical protein